MTEEATPLSSEKSQKVAALIMAAGMGHRFGDSLPKQYHLLGPQYQNQSVLKKTIDVFLHYPDIDHVVVVIGAHHRPHYEKAVQGVNASMLMCVEGGGGRYDSVKRGLQALQSISPRWVIIHDGVRPFLTPLLIHRVLDSLKQGADGCVPVIPVTDTLKHVNEQGEIIRTVPRQFLYRAQTPQGFCYQTLWKGYQQPLLSPEELTDDAMILEQQGGKVETCPGDPYNIKITYKEDLTCAMFG